MTKIFSIVFLFMFSFLLCQINLDEIKHNVTENPQKYYYDNLEIFKRNPENLSQEQLNFIYYGSNFVDYGFKRGEFNKNLAGVRKFAGRKTSKKLSQETLEKAHLLYNINPLNKELLQDLVLLTQRVGDEKNNDLHTLQRRLLIETIGNSGSGLLEENAIVVTNFADQFLALEQFSKVFAPGISFKSKVLPDGSWLNIYKNGIDLFFIKTIHHKDMFKDD